VTTRVKLYKLVVGTATKLLRDTHGNSVISMSVYTKASYTVPLCFLLEIRRPFLVLFLCDQS